MSDQYIFIYNRGINLINFPFQNVFTVLINICVSISIIIYNSILKLRNTKFEKKKLLYKKLPVQDLT